MQRKTLWKTSRRQGVLALAHGSKFGLIVGDRYALGTTDKAALATLDEQAGTALRGLGGKTATVSGSVDGDTIQASRCLPSGGGEPGPTERGLFGKPKLKSLLLRSRRVVVHCLAFCPAPFPRHWTGH